MTYAITSGLAFILNLIMNRDALRNTKSRFGEKDEEHRTSVHYCFFVMLANIFFVADFVWGILYEHHGNQSLFPLLYVVCILYFVSMFLTMLAWICYIVAYLNKKRLRSRLMLIAAWLMFSSALFCLLVNIWKPFMFSFNEQGEYIPESGRYIAFIFQIAVYILTSGYMFCIAHRSIGKEKVRYNAVGSACLLIDLFLILQVFDSGKPFYTMGLIIAICTMHAYVELGERKEKSVYDSIAKGLAEDYAAMYYIDTETGEYQEYVASEEYKSMNIPIKGRDFFGEAMTNIDAYVYPDDRELARTMYSKEKMLANLEGRKSFSYKYRLMVNGEPRIFLFTIKLTNDGKNLVLYEKDIEEDIRAEIKRKEKEKQHLKELNTEKELARRDELTGLKNKNAYFELVQSVQNNIDNGLDYLPFALVVCDANDLKKTNDTEGHVAGDEYIKSSANLLREIFTNSPIFRVGGDEFVVFLRSDDYTNRESLMKKLRNRVLDNIKTGARPILATGMAEYIPGRDGLVSDIFDRADKEMYENKESLKEKE